MKHRLKYLSIMAISIPFAHAAKPLDVLQAGMPYSDVKNTLLQQQWLPVNNTQINASSLYAQELYEHGIIEVADCISMELDACWFEYSKGKQLLRVKTVTRQLLLDSYELKKR